MDPVGAVSAAFGPRPELRGSPAVLILCFHRGPRGQEPLEDLHLAPVGRKVERSVASGRARGEKHLSGQKEVENCRVFVPSSLGESLVKIPVKTLYFGTNKNDQRAITANADFSLLRGQVLDEL